MNSKLERLSHYGILVVALSAVVVSIWQARILQEHNKLSVKPFMDNTVITRTTDSIRVQTVHISNRGIGPAIIKKIVYTFKGEKYDSIDEVVAAADIRTQVTDIFGYGPNTIMSPDSELLVIRLKKESYDAIGIGVSIQYQSIYEEDFDFNFGF